MHHRKQQQLHGFFRVYASPLLLKIFIFAFCAKTQQRKGEGAGGRESPQLSRNLSHESQERANLAQPSKSEVNIIE